MVFLFLLHFLLRIILFGLAIGMKTMHADFAPHYTLIMNILCTLYALIYEFEHRKLPTPLSLSSRVPWKINILGLGESLHHDEMQNHCLVSICSISYFISMKILFVWIEWIKNRRNGLDAWLESKIALGVSYTVSLFILEFLELECLEYILTQNIVLLLFTQIWRHQTISYIKKLIGLLQLCIKREHIT